MNDNKNDRVNEDELLKAFLTGEPLDFPNDDSPLTANFVGEEHQKKQPAPQLESAKTDSEKDIIREEGTENSGFYKAAKEVANKEKETESESTETEEDVEPAEENEETDSTILPGELDFLSQPEPTEFDDSEIKNPAYDDSSTETLFSGYPPVMSAEVLNYDEDEEKEETKKKTHSFLKNNPLKKLETIPWKIKGPVIAIVAILLIALALFAIPSGNNDNDTNGTDDQPIASGQQAAPPIVDTQSGIIIPSSVEAKCPAGSTDPILAFNTNRQDAWVCKRVYGVDLVWVTINFDKPTTIDTISIIPGWDYVDKNNRDYWVEHRHVTRILWELGGDDTTQIAQNLPNTRAESVQKINSRPITKLMMQIQKTEAPNKRASSTTEDDFAINQIIIRGTQK